MFYNFCIVFPKLTTLHTNKSTTLYGTNTLPKRKLTKLTGSTDSCE